MSDGQAEARGAAAAKAQAVRTEAALPPQVEALDDMGCPIGRDPRRMSVAELEAVGHRKEPLLRLIRRNCIECAGGHEAEVRRCALVRCPFWPYRMNTNPFAAEQSEAQQAARRESLQAARAKRADFADLRPERPDEEAAEVRSGADIPAGPSRGANEALDQGAPGETVAP